jgi:alkyl hydroperoxide reductase subunit AhpF|tara:strand:- start:395 stop:565 length:171 start_codon:yes stop_codon:yes gene_type:complete
MKMYSRPKVNKMKEVADAVDAMVDEVKTAKKSTKKRRPSYKSRMAGTQTGKYSSDA